MRSWALAALVGLLVADAVAQEPRVLAGSDLRAELDALRDPRDPRRRELALRRLVLRGDEGAPALKEMARSGRSSPRLLALRALAAMGRLERPLQAWSALAAEGSRRERRGAALQLAGLPGPRAVERLRALAADECDDVRAAALAGLAARGESSAGLPLPEEGSFETLRRLWAEAAWGGAPELLAAALGAPALRREVCEVLARYGPPVDAAPLVAAVRTARGRPVAAERALVQRVLFAGGAASERVWAQYAGDAPWARWLLDCLPWVDGDMHIATIAALWKLEDGRTEDRRDHLAELIRRLRIGSDDSGALLSLYRAEGDASRRRAFLEITASRPGVHGELLHAALGDADGLNRRVAFRALARSAALEELLAAASREADEANYGAFGRALAGGRGEEIRPLLQEWTRASAAAQRLIALYGLERLPVRAETQAVLVALHARERELGGPRWEVLRVLTRAPGHSALVRAELAAIGGDDWDLARDQVAMLRDPLRVEAYGEVLEQLRLDPQAPLPVRIEAAIGLALGGDVAARGLLVESLDELPWDPQTRAFEAICAHPWSANAALLERLEREEMLPADLLVEGCAQMPRLAEARERIDRALAPGGDSQLRQAALRSLGRFGARGRELMAEWLRRGARDPAFLSGGDAMALVEACRGELPEELAAPLADFFWARCAAGLMLRGARVRPETRHILDALDELGPTGDAALTAAWNAGLRSGVAAEIAPGELAMFLGGWGAALPDSAAAVGCWLLSLGDGDADQRYFAHQHRALGRARAGDWPGAFADLAAARAASAELGRASALPPEHRPALDLRGSGNLPARWACWWSLEQSARALAAGDSQAAVAAYERALDQAFFDVQARRTALVFGVLNSTVREHGRLAGERWWALGPRQPGFGLMLYRFARYPRVENGLGPPRSPLMPASSPDERADALWLVAWLKGRLEDPGTAPARARERDPWLVFRARLWRAASEAPGGRR